MGKEISTIRVRRFNPEVDREPYYQTYHVPHDQNATVLNCLDYIYEHLDPGLSFRRECKIGVCVSCLMVINGRAGFACLRIAEKEMTLEPQVKKAVLVKDLATDFGRD